MSIKQRAKQKLIELPLIISDHADWNELTNTIVSTEAEEVLITHGHEECLKYWCKTNKIFARTLSLNNNEKDN
jgi:putative mRNA 3-end processing factor